LPHQPMGDQEVLLQEYSQILIRKLEEKALQLEETNRSLQEDIAARERAEAARDKAEGEASERAAVLDALFESVPDAVTHIDLEGNVQLVNRSPIPADPEPQVGSSWLLSGPVEQRETMKRAFDTVTKTGKPTSFEAVLTGTNGDEKVFWNTMAPVVRDGRITGAVVVARDITERKQTEAQLIVSDRMASVGSLAAGVAHEINNPLASVAANLALITLELEAMARLAPVPRDLLDEVRDARDSAERVRLIARDLKIFSRGDEAKRGPVDVELVLESTLRMASNELRHRARVTRDYGRVPPVQANASRLGQVFLNLIINAAQAIPEGDQARNEVRVATSVDAQGKRVVITVSDTGSGIPLAVQRRLFTPFVTTKPVGVGTGLGLSICHRIITALDGTIDFSSELGKGTTFQLSFPIAAVEAPVATPPPATAPSVWRRGKILVVDDEVMIAQVIRRVLSRHHDVSVADSAQKAMALFTAGERFDVVLCDLMMPQITGMDLHGFLVDLDRKQADRVVFMTGGAFTPTARTFVDQIPNHIIEKPFEVQALLALVNRVVG
jgi:PAS domain S-box-containing protein